MIDLIVSQGRVADRAERMIEGAALTARALEDRYGLKARWIGTPSPIADDDWTVSLPQARPTIAGVAEAVAASLGDGRKPVTLANTCSVSLGVLPVVARLRPDAVVLYIDAHGDFHTPETTGSGYLGGMVLSGACGLWDSGHGAGLRPEQAVLVGARDIDPAERPLIDSAGVRVIPPPQTTPDTILNLLNGSPVWVHIDWDVLEPGYIPADYTVPDGVLPSQIRALFQAIPQDRLLGVELAEFNAPADSESTGKALATILDMVAPVFDAPLPR